MPRALAAVLASLAVLFAACGSGGRDTPQDREDDLRKTVVDVYTALFTGDAGEAYDSFSSDFQDACAESDFRAVMAFVSIFLGGVDNDDIDIEVTDIRFEDDRAFVTVEGTVLGEEVSGADEAAVGEFWVLEDGDWKLGTDEEDPCDSGGIDFGSDDDATPASGPGSSRGEPAPLGEPVESDNLRITVLDVDLDAGSRLEELGAFDPTPVTGRRVVLVRVMAEHVGDDSDETVSIYESVFKITGSANVIYDAFQDDISCGFIDDSIQGEMFPGGSIEGYVCFQVPESEADLILIADHGFERDRRYFALQ